MTTPTPTEAPVPQTSDPPTTHQHKHKAHRRRHVRKALGYAFDPAEVVDREVERVRGFPNDFGLTLSDYILRLATACGLMKYKDIITVRNPADPYGGPLLCVPVATTFSRELRIVRTDVLEKARPS